MNTKKPNRRTLSHNGQFPCLSKAYGEQNNLSSRRGRKPKRSSTRSSCTLSLPNPSVQSSGVLKRNSSSNFKRKLFPSYELTKLSQLESKLKGILDAIKHESTVKVLGKEFLKTLQTLDQSFVVLKTKKIDFRKSMILCEAVVLFSIQLLEKKVCKAVHLKYLLEQLYTLIFVFNQYLKSQMSPKKPRSLSLDKKLRTRSTQSLINKYNSNLSTQLESLAITLEVHNNQTPLSSCILQIVANLSKISYSKAHVALQKATKEPYLPPSKRTYTLVLDLDETLVHYIENEEDGTLLVRPGCEFFLKEVAKYYEVVIFTAGTQEVRVK